MARDDDIALVFANLKGPKSKDFLGTANALHRLKKEPDLNTNAKLGRHFSVSGEIIRQFLVLRDLPSEVQKLFSEGKLGLEQGRRIWQLYMHPPRKDYYFAVALAEAMVGLTAHRSRDLVSFLEKHPEASVEDAREGIVRAMPVTRRTYGVVASLPKEQFDKLKREADNRNQSVNDLVKQIVDDWLSAK